MPKPPMMFEVDRLSCAGCVARAERALSAVPGVDQAQVNIANAMATVLGEPQINDLHKALKDAGYPAREETHRLTIANMTCASCVARVEQALTKATGVLSAHVNLATGQVDVTILKGAATVDDLVGTVESAGYKAAAQGDNTQSESPMSIEQAALRRDLILAATLTAPVFVMEMGGHLFPALHHWMAGMFGAVGLQWTAFVLITAVLVGPGRRFFTTGVPLLLKATPDMNSLVALGTFAAWAYSSLVLFAPDFLPASARVVYFESAGVIVTLVLLGRWLETRAKGRTGDAIKGLIQLRPDTVRIERDGDFFETTVEQVRRGDHIALRPGDRVPVDGHVLKGATYIDESMLTGEPMPVAKTSGDAVFAGTLNGSGAITFAAEKVGTDTVLARIIAMVQQAQGSKLPIQALADRIVLWFVPAVLVIAAIAGLVWLIFGPVPSGTYALVAAVTVLIIACPCAMGLATPTSIMVGMGRAAQMGILFRKGDALQRLTDVSVVAFDKTGTLTEGQPEVVSVRAATGWSDADILTFAAAAEQHSEHPIARALERAAEQSLPMATDVQAVVGRGLVAMVSGRRVLVGSPAFMSENMILTGPVQTELVKIEDQGQTPVLIAIDGSLAGVFAIADRIKPSALHAVAQLRNAGLHVAMISGDAERTAQAIATTIGIQEVIAGVLPDGKVVALSDLRQRFGPVAFIGDGLNDAPALASADVGVALGTGTDVAIEAGDIVMMSGDLNGIVRARALSAATMRNIRQNLAWAFGYNIALIPVAAGVLYPFMGVVLSPMLAAAAMALSSVFVVSNALRLGRISLEKRSDQPEKVPPLASERLPE